jgi:hypothetical protein
MPINRKNRAPSGVAQSPIVEPQVKETVWTSPAERPVLDGPSLMRAQIAAAVAQVQAESRTGPAAELIREIEDELAPVLDPTRVNQEDSLWRKWALKEKKRAARLQRDSPAASTPSEIARAAARGQENHNSPAAPAQTSPQPAPQTLTRAARPGISQLRIHQDSTFRVDFRIGFAEVAHVSRHSTRQNQGSSTCPSTAETRPRPALPKM